MNVSVLRDGQCVAFKRIGVVAICAMIIAVAGCGALPGSSSTPSETVAASSGDDTLDSAVRQIYTKDYAYTKTNVSTYDEETVTVVSQGEVSQSPYREHVKVTSSSSQIWDEAYFHDNGSALLHTESGWQKTRSNRTYPYGHNRKLDIAGTDTDGEVRVYTTRYTENVGKGYGIDDLTATVAQTYRIDADGNLLSIGNRSERSQSCDGNRQRHVGQWKRSHGSREQRRNNQRSCLHGDFGDSRSWCGAIHRDSEGMNDFVLS